MGSSSNWSGSLQVLAYCKFTILMFCEDGIVSLWLCVSVLTGYQLLRSLTNIKYRRGWFNGLLI